MMNPVAFMPFDPNQPLIGSNRHGFVTMGQLVDALTEAYDTKRWLLAEESCAMILNHARFMWHFGLIDDRLMFRDCFFFVTTKASYEEEVADASDAQDDRWYLYAELPDMNQDVIYGVMKNKPRNRRHLDSENIPMKRYEVRGSLRARRRYLLPDNFEEIVGPEIVRPMPELMVVQYQLRPLAKREVRVEKAAELEIETELEVLLDLKDPQPGPERPPGIWPAPHNHGDADGDNHGGPDGGDDEPIDAVPLAWAPPENPGSSGGGPDGGNGGHDEPIEAVPLALAAPEHPGRSGGGGSGHEDGGLGVHGGGEDDPIGALPLAWAAPEQPGSSRGRGSSRNHREEAGGRDGGGRGGRVTGRGHSEEPGGRRGGRGGGRGHSERPGGGHGGWGNAEEVAAAEAGPAATRYLLAAIGLLRLRDYFREAQAQEPDDDAEM
ncbi:unnamed protein product [Urochloa humidicola]